jgi:hypothetical protein
MPAILPNEEAVSAWLDDNLHGFDALKVLQPPPKSEVIYFVSLENMLLVCPTNHRSNIVVLYIV